MSQKCSAIFLFFLFFYRIYFQRRHERNIGSCIQLSTFRRCLAIMAENIRDKNRLTEIGGEKNHLRREDLTRVYTEYVYEESTESRALHCCERVKARNLRGI